MVGQEQKIVLKREFGDDFLETLSHNSASSTLHAVEELVANSWDADATRVDITLRDGQLIIQDNGTGMTPEGITDFYRIGNSKKKKLGSSPKGRPYFGNFGLATLSLRMLAKQYTLETISDGHKTIAFERFPQTLDTKDEIESKILSSNGDPSGTKLHLEELIVSQKDFTTEKLLNHLAWALPVDEPDFVLTVNGAKVVPKAIETAYKFDFSYNGEKSGKSLGTIFLTRNPVPEHGVYIRVNGRRIGNPREIINLNELNDSTARRILARISADGLKPYIRSDRGGFRSCEAYEEFKIALTESLREVARFNEAQSQTKKAMNLSKRKEPILKDVVQKLRRAEVEEVIGGAKLKFKDMPHHIPASFDSKENTIYLNPDYPTISTQKVANATLYRQGVLMATIDAIAEQRAKQGNGTLEEAQKHKALILDGLKSTGSTKQANLTLYPSLHYSPAALAEITGKNLTTIRYIAENQALVCKDDEIIGRSYLELVEKSVGLNPLPDFVARKILTPGKNLYQQIERFTEIFTLMGQNASPFVRKFGSAYFVEGSCEEGIARELRDIHLGSMGAKIAQTLLHYGKRFLSPTEIGSETRLDQKKIYQVIEYAKSQDITIRTEGRGNPSGYQFGDFVAALQRSRGNPKDLSRLVV